MNLPELAPMDGDVRASGKGCLFDQIRLNDPPCRRGVRATRYSGAIQFMFVVKSDMSS